MGAISIKELLHQAPYNKDDRSEAYPATGELLDNANILVRRVNSLLRRWSERVYVSSGYRPSVYNQAAGGSPNSAHKSCEAVDIKDPEGKLGKFITENPWLLQQADLYMEDTSRTKTWVHLQIRPTASKKRIFMP